MSMQYSLNINCVYIKPNRDTWDTDDYLKPAHVSHILSLPI